MANIPATSNVFGSLDTPRSRREVAGLFGAAGWQVRRCAHDDYEVTCDWAELTIEGSAPVLLHGLVADVLTRAEALAELLRDARLAFQLECYGPAPQRRLLLVLQGDA